MDTVDTTEQRAHATAPGALGTQLEGASAGPPSPDRESMLVWLKGDEPECAEFVLTADAVMEQLGIKRSRLTQISGKELRVGRMRRGRYVSPVYRQADVDEYLAWTRATASHLKSSSILSEAADELLRRGDALTQELARAPGALGDEVRGALRRTAVAVERAVRDVGRGVEQRVAATEDRLDGVEARLRQLLIGLSDGLAKEAAGRSELTVAVKVLGREVAEVAALTRVEREAQAERRVEILEEMDALRDALEACLAPPEPAPPLPQVRRGGADARRVQRLASRSLAPEGARPSPFKTAREKAPRRPLRSRR